MDYNKLVLNRFFTQYVFQDLISDFNCQSDSNILKAVIKRYVSDSTDKDNGKLISEVYSYMSKSHRNEYFYQNTLLNKLLLGRHSVNTTTALTQIPIGKSKADFILINGKAVVYEIKTELDSFDRLETQLANYYKAFNHVCVVTCESNFEKINSMLSNSPVGIYILTDKNTLSLRKDPAPFNNSLDYSILFKVLHKHEFEQIILDVYKTLPSCTPVFYYEECFNLFSKIPIGEVYLLALRQLKKRNKIIQEQFNEVPYELKSLFYFSNSLQKNCSRLSYFLNQQYGG